jgi:hypothetical protein
MNGSENKSVFQHRRFSLDVEPSLNQRSNHLMSPCYNFPWAIYYFSADQNAPFVCGTRIFLAFISIPPVDSAFTDPGDSFVRVLHKYAHM